MLPDAFQTGKSDKSRCMALHAMLALKLFVTIVLALACTEKQSSGSLSTGLLPPSTREVLDRNETPYGDADDIQLPTYQPLHS